MVPTPLTDISLKPVSHDQSVRHHCRALAKCRISSSLAPIYDSYVYAVYHDSIHCIHVSQSYCSEH